MVDWFVMIETVAQINSSYNRGMQETIYEHTTCQTLKQV